MANLKQDLLNNLQNEKYYDELELARLAQDPNMNYKEKVDNMSVVLKNIADVDLATQLIGKYFPEQQPAPAPEQPAPAPEQPAPDQPQAHPGQSHGE